MGEVYVASGNLIPSFSYSINFKKYTDDIYDSTKENNSNNSTSAGKRNTLSFMWKLSNV